MVMTIFKENTPKLKTCVDVNEHTQTASEGQDSHTPEIAINQSSQDRPDLLSHLETKRPMMAKLTTKKQKALVP